VTGKGEKIPKALPRMAAARAAALLSPRFWVVQPFSESIVEQKKRHSGYERLSVSPIFD
jgi:hypothetical protein